MSIPRKRFMSSAKAREFDDDALDRLDTAYRGEYLRWHARRQQHPKGGVKETYELFRNGSESGYAEVRDRNDDTVVKLTKREALNYSEAEGWLNTYRGRAAMKAVLEAL